MIVIILLSLLHIISRWLGKVLNAIASTWASACGINKLQMLQNNRASLCTWAAATSMLGTTVETIPLAAGTSIHLLQNSIVDLLHYPNCLHLRSRVPRRSKTYCHPTHKHVIACNLTVCKTTQKLQTKDLWSLHRQSVLSVCRNVSVKHDQQIQTINEHLSFRGSNCIM